MSIHRYALSVQEKIGLETVSIFSYYKLFLTQDSDYLLS